MELEKAYDPKKYEGEIYEAWEKSGYFNPDNLPKRNKENWSMAVPPPNVTGNLHIGHAYEHAIQDVVARFERMRGKKVLWLPGTDHAAIATQSKVEKKLYDEERKTRHDLGREEFVERVNKFALESQNTILNQLRKIGDSLDWSRLVYTLDKKREMAVRTAFKRLYDAGLIYRGNRIVNWDPNLKTTVSDDEVERVEKKTPFYYLKYGPFVIATARPETKFGDKYVVMHPDDKRYKEYKHGQKIELEWINGKITATIIKDEAIDMEFGTGVMTITPWHDATDFEIAERHNLDKEQIIDLEGKLLPIAGEFSGMHIKKARPLIVEKLREKGLVEKIDENYVHAVAVNSRGGGTIEPQIIEQWFVSVDTKFKLKDSKLKSISSGSKVSIKEVMEKVVASGEVKITPKQFEKRYFHWAKNLRDWNISRQLWFGHRIPVWYHDSKCIPIPGREDEVSKCKTIIISETKPKCKHCSAEFTQDPDTLDTWFSSGLWTFSTLGWPEKTKDLENFHPTNLIDPGYEILYLWVSRMIFLSVFLLGEVPFRTALIHGIVRDEKGRKFSKSSGIGGDPLEVVEEYGADALRMALISGTAIGNDPVFQIEKVKAYKHFANKIWNVSRFVLMNLEDFNEEDVKNFSEKDNETLGELSSLVKDVTDDIENFRFHLASEKLYHYFWHTFADKIIEDTKDRLRGEDKKEKQQAQSLLYKILKTNLRMLHPFMPFVTEVIWQKLPDKETDLIMVSEWPAA